MSAKRNVRDDAVEFVMNKPLDVASEFVQFLASVVKARDKGLQRAGIKPAPPVKAKPPAGPKPPSARNAARQQQAEEAIAAAGSSPEAPAGSMFPTA